MDAVSCVVHEFFGNIAALLCGTPHYSHAILDCVGNCTGCTRSLVSGFGDVFRRFFQYGF